MAEGVSKSCSERPSPKKSTPSVPGISSSTAISTRGGIASAAIELARLTMRARLILWPSKAAGCAALLKYSSRERTVCRLRRNTICTSGTISPASVAAALVSGRSAARIIATASSSGRSEPEEPRETRT
jgi:hypothetical protein